MLTLFPFLMCISSAATKSVKTASTFDNPVSRPITSDEKFVNRFLRTSRRKLCNVCPHILCQPVSFCRRNGASGTYIQRKFILRASSSLKSRHTPLKKLSRNRLQVKQIIGAQRRDLGNQSWRVWSQ